MITLLGLTLQELLNLKICFVQLKAWDVVLWLVCLVVVCQDTIFSLERNRAN